MSHTGFLGGLVFTFWSSCCIILVDIVNNFIALFLWGGWEGDVGFMFNFDVEGVFSSGVDNLTKALSDLSANYKQDGEEFQVNHAFPEVLDFSVFKNDKTVAKKFTVKPFNTPMVEGVGKHVKETLIVNKSPILDPLTTVMEGLNHLVNNPQVNLAKVNFPEILNTFLTKPGKKGKHGKSAGHNLSGLGNDQFVFFDRYKIFPAFINEFLNNMHIQRFFYLTLSDWTIIQAIHIPAAVLIGGALGCLVALPPAIFAPVIAVVLTSLVTIGVGVFLTIVITTLLTAVLSLATDVVVGIATAFVVFWASVAAWVIFGGGGAALAALIVAASIAFIIIPIIGAIPAVLAITILLGGGILIAAGLSVTAVAVGIFFWAIACVGMFFLIIATTATLVFIGVTIVFGLVFFVLLVPLAILVSVVMGPALLVIVSAIGFAFLVSAFIKLLGRPHFMRHHKHKKHVRKHKAPKAHHKKPAKPSKPGGKGKHHRKSSDRGVLDEVDKQLRKFFYNVYYKNLPTNRRHGRKPVAPHKHRKHNTELITPNTNNLQVVLTSQDSNREVLLEPTLSKPLLTIGNPLLKAQANAIPAFDSPHQLPVNLNNMDVKVMQAFTQFLVVNDFFIKEFTTNFHPAGLYPTDINTDGDTLGDPADDDDTVVADNNTNDNEGDWVTAGDGMMCAPNDGGGVDCHPITPSDEEAMNQAVAEQQQAANPTPVVVTPLPTAANPNPTPKVITPKPHKVYPTPLTGLVERIDYYVHLNIKTGRNSKWFNFIEQVFGTSKHPGPYRFILLATAGLLDNM